VNGHRFTFLNFESEVSNNPSQKVGRYQPPTPRCQSGKSIGSQSGRKASGPLGLHQTFGSSRIFYPHEIKLARDTAYQISLCTTLTFTKDHSNYSLPQTYLLGVPTVVRGTESNQRNRKLVRQLRTLTLDFGAEIRKDRTMAKVVKFSTYRRTCSEIRL
jgi:hypothetical protein